MTGQQERVRRSRLSKTPWDISSQGHKPQASARSAGLFAFPSGQRGTRIVFCIHYNCIGAFDVPDRRKIPEADIIMETRKGVALSYAPEQVAV